MGCVAGRFSFVSVMSDGCVPEHCFLSGIRGRSDLFGPIAPAPARDNRCAFQLALIVLLMLVITAVWGLPLQGLLQLWVLPGADLLTQSAFPLDLLEHGRVPTYPGHLRNLAVSFSCSSLWGPHWRRVS